MKKMPWTPAAGKISINCQYIVGRRYKLTTISGCVLSILYIAILIYGKVIQRRYL